MTAVCVVIPWWPDTDDPWRSRWREQVAALWVARGYEVVIGEGVEGAARNRGIGVAIDRHGAEIVILCDADAIITDRVAREAVALAAMEHGLVIPHSRFVYLSRSRCSDLTAGEAAEVLAGVGEWPTRTDEVNGYRSECVGQNSVGGVSVFSVPTWVNAGGYDECIIRAYDAAFALATGTLVAPQRRLRGDFVHLWHPREDEEDPPETWALLRRYHAAAEKGPSAMRALVAERSVVSSDAHDRMSR